MPSTIKYHINIPVDTTKYSLQQAHGLVEDALKVYDIASINIWKATLGASGWRVSVVFNLPFPINARALETPVYNECVAEKWELNGPVVAWIHP